MPPFVSRLLAVCAVIAVIAIAAPSVLPAMLAAVMGEDNARVASAPAAPQSRAGENEGQRLPDPPAQIRSFTVEADERGHYVVDAAINGRSITALIDTGATTVALTAETARRLGVTPPQSAFTVPIATANGKVMTAPVKLDDVAVGNVSVRNVQALVVPEGALEVDLLGMSFLGRLTRYEAARGSLLLVE